METSLSLERRRATRVAIAIPVELRDERGFSLHASSDLSPGGAYFALAIPHPIGSQVEVTLRLPGDAPIVCRGEVVNIPDATRFGMGVRFLDIREEDRTRLEALIDPGEPVR
jgi:uncharacterized protein (TIGR02266 family)